MYVDPMLYAAEELANAIIIKAVEDYRKAMKDLWLCPRSVNARHTIIECESFFRSPYFNTLTSVDGVWQCGICTRNNRHRQSHQRS